MQVCNLYRTFFPLSVGGVETQICLTTNLLAKLDSNLHFTLLTDRQYLFPLLHPEVPKTQNYGTLKVFRLGPNFSEVLLFGFQHYLQLPKARLMWMKRLVVDQLFSEVRVLDEVKDADVFHTNVAGEDLMDLAICEDLAIRLSASFGKPLLVQLHGTFLPGAETMHLSEDRRLPVLECARVILTHNMNVLEQLREWGFENKSILVPICVDLEEFKPRFSYPKRHGFEIAFVGRLAEYRDPETAVRAFHIVRQMLPVSKLHIVGSGPLEGKIRLLIRNLGLENSVFVYGARRDVANLLRSCDVFWATSAINNYPSNSLAEALASGLPAVATDVGLTRELIVDDENGFLIPASSPKALADATLRIFSDDELYERLSGNAHNTAEKYDCKIAYREIAKLYHNIA